jgi:peptidoglycan/xylan/chitin deacetylase (PgdA/CDA1 family)
MYHSIDRSGSPVSTPPELFARQMTMLAASGASVVDLETCLATDNCVALTFDDGYRSFLHEALPVLERCAFPCTLFVVSGMAGSFNEWDAGMPRFPRHELMNWDEIREAARCRVTIGAHSVSHADLTRIAPAAAQADMARSKEEIQQHIGEAVRCFAYPYGRSTAPLRARAKELFPIACGTDLGYLGHSSDRLNLPRIDSFYVRREAIFQRLFSPWTAAWIGARGVARRLRSHS